MTFSVIIPTHNRHTLLEQSLESLFRQDFADFEIIVVNDGSTDATDERLLEYSAGGKIQYIKQSRRGPGAGRNAGIVRAQGRYLAFTDDDCVVPVDWLRRFSDVFNSGRVDIIGGTVQNCIDNNIYSQLSQEIVNHFVSNLNKNGRASGFLTSNNIAYNAQGLRNAGCFEERFRVAGGEERAVNARILRNGGISTLIPGLVVKHYHRMTARSFFRQQRNYGRGAFLLHRIIARELQLPPTALPVSAYATLVASWLNAGILAGSRKLFLFVTGQAMVMIGFLLEALSSGSRGAPASR